MRRAFRQLVEAYRRHEVPDEGTRDAMLARLLESPPRPSARPWGRVVVSVGVTVALAAAVLLLLRGGFWVLAAGAPQPVPDAAMHGRQGTATESKATAVEAANSKVRTTPPAIDPPEVVEAIPEPESVAPARPQPSVHRERPRAPTPTTEPAPADRIREEAQLLARAQAALAGGSPEAALPLLDEHRRDFPRGMMVLERTALRAIALCLTGDTDKGRGVAQRLFSEHPEAPHRARVQRACGELSAPDATVP